MNGGWLVSFDRDDRVESPHRCPSSYSFEVQLADGRVPLYYWPAARMWGIPRLQADRLYADWMSFTPMIAVQFCPWCGEEFPPPLHSELQEALAELGLAEGDPNAPSKYHDETWWREAGL